LSAKGTSVVVGKEGRLVLPKDLREKYGVRETVSGIESRKTPFPLFLQPAPHNHHKRSINS